MLDVDRDELLSSVPTHQSSEVYPHFLHTFAVYRNRETTVRSQTEIFVSCVRNLRCAAKNFADTCESSGQRSIEAMFVVALKLSSSTVKNADTTGRSV